MRPANLRGGILFSSLSSRRPRNFPVRLRAGFYLEPVFDFATYRSSKASSSTKSQYQTPYFSTAFQNQTPPIPPSKPNQLTPSSSSRRLRPCRARLQKCSSSVQAKTQLYSSCQRNIVLYELKASRVHHTVQYLPFTDPRGVNKKIQEGKKGGVEIPYESCCQARWVSSCQRHIVLYELKAVQAMALPSGTGCLVQVARP